MSKMTTLLTEEEAAKNLRIPPRALARIRKEGRISYLPISRGALYTPDHLAEFIASIEVRAQAKSAPRYGYRGAGVHSDRNYEALAGIV